MKSNKYWPGTVQVSNEEHPKHGKTVWFFAIVVNPTGTNVVLKHDIDTDHFTIPADKIISPPDLMVWDIGKRVHIQISLVTAIDENILAPSEG